MLVREECLGAGHPGIPHGTDLEVALAAMAIDLAGSHNARRARVVGVG